MKNGEEETNVVEEERIVKRRQQTQGYHHPTKFITMALSFLLASSSSSRTVGAFMMTPRNTCRRNVDGFLGRMNGSIRTSSSSVSSFNAIDRLLNQQQHQSSHALTFGVKSNSIVRTMSSMAASETDASSVPPKASDRSAASKSRAPFSSPRGSYDDSSSSSPTNAGTEESADIAWSKLGLTSDITTVLTNKLGFLDGPTPVQKMAVPALLSESASVAFAASTGSGKTLAYLLPIIQCLKSEELLLTSTITTPGEDAAAANEAAAALSKLRRPKRPRAIVLAPTRELAQQILSVLKVLSHQAKISAELLVGGEDNGKQRKRLESRPVDILVATPGRLVKHRDNSNVFLGSVKHVVIDEMDTMLEQGFQSDIGSLLHPMLYKQKVVREGDELELVEGAPRLILTSATMTNAVKRLLNHPDLPFKARRDPPRKKDDGDENSKDESILKIALPTKQTNMRILTAPGLHRAVPRLRQTFVDVGQADKLSLLVDVVARSGGEGSALSTKDKQQSIDNESHRRPLTLVFCNTVSSCRAAEHALAESGVNSLCYHGGLNSVDRAANLKTFREVGSSNDDEEAPTVLVCTDIAARGLDVPEVDHVVMFDFPLNPIDYLHRAGRTARGGADRDRSGKSEGQRRGVRPGNGRVTALVAKRDRVLAMAIENAVRNGEPIDGLSSRKSDYLPGGRLGAGSSGSRGGGGGGGDGNRGGGGRGNMEKQGRGRQGGRGGRGGRRGRR